MNKPTNAPSHRIYAVTKSKDGKQNYWRSIGAAFGHSDGDGFTLKLEYLPLNDADIVLRKPKEDDAKAEAEAPEEA